MIRACKNFEIEKIFFRRFYFRFALTPYFHFRCVARASFDRNLIHSADACFLVMACVGYSRAHLKTLSSLLKAFLWIAALLQFGAINSDGTLVTVQFGNFIIKI